jgi:hypothetical protein
MKIFVAGLPYDLDDAELEENSVNNVLQVAIDKETGKTRFYILFVTHNHATELWKL